MRAFVFPGQGAQTIGMGRDLAEAYPSARAVFDAVNEALGEDLSGLVWSGDADTLDIFITACKEAGISCQPLTVSHAFHSHLMDPILDEFESFALSIDFALPTIPLISNLTGEIVDEQVITPTYWREHIRGSVRFADGVKSLVDQELDALVEMGPTPVLTAMAKRCQPDWVIPTIASLRKGRPDVDAILDGVADRAPERGGRHLALAQEVGRVGADRLRGRSRALVGADQDERRQGAAEARAQRADQLGAGAAAQTVVDQQTVEQGGRARGQRALRIGRGDDLVALRGILPEIARAQRQVGLVVVDDEQPHGLGHGEGLAASGNGDDGARGCAFGSHDRA